MFKTEKGGALWHKADRNPKQLLKGKQGCKLLAKAAKLAWKPMTEPTFIRQTCLSDGKGDFPFPFQAFDQFIESKGLRKMHLLMKRWNY